MGLVRTNFSFSLSNGVHVEHLQCYTMLVGMTVWSNIYEVGVLGIRDMIYAQYGRKFTDVEFTTRSLCFSEFIRSTKLRMIVIN